MPSRSSGSATRSRPSLRRRAEDPDYLAAPDLVRDRVPRPSLRPAGAGHGRERGQRSRPTICGGFVDRSAGQGQSGGRRRRRRHRGRARAAARPRVRRSAGAAARRSRWPRPRRPAAGTVVVRKDVPQSQVLFGQAGLARDDPDFYAAYVANHILGGGGFTSRLTEEVREKRGLAYSVYSYLYPMDYRAALDRRARHRQCRGRRGDRGGPRADRADGRGRDRPAGARRRQDLSDRLVSAAPDQQRRDRRACWSRCRSTTSASTISSGATTTSRR